MDGRISTLPSVLRTGAGTDIASAEDWERIRRPELMELFRRHIYGREPAVAPDSVSCAFETTQGWMGGAAVRKTVTVRYAGPYGEGSFPLYVFLPSGAPKPVPALLLIHNREPEIADPDRNERHDFWPAEAIVARGYAAAVLHNRDIDPDAHDGFRNGVHPLYDNPETARPGDAWGTIAAWSWGASRALDALSADADIDSTRVAVIGHSRGGKAALWAGAIDERFAMVVSNNSGCTGAAIARGKRGERVKDINDRFPHWFCENYKRFNGREHELPVDQHMLLASIAPRPLYVTSATEDEWADPVSEFASLIAAEPAYRLYGLQGLGTSRFPAADTPIIGDRVGYHIRAGEHDMTAYDWHRFMDFADRFMTS